MRRLEITPEMVRQHLAAYDDGIMHGLEELANGRKLIKRYMRSGKGVYKACQGNLIDACAPKSFELLYVSYVFCFYRHFRSSCTVLGFPPNILERSARQFARFDRKIIRRFGDKSPEYKSWSKGKKKVSLLFNYDEFSNGRKLVADECNNLWYFHWAKNPQWSSWYFLKQLGTSTCSYCNSDGVFTIEHKQGLKGHKYKGQNNSSNEHKKSELDHFWPRARFPFLGLSLYNLVPSCSRCNRNFKGEKLPWGMIQPYRDDFHVGANFYIIFKDYKGMQQPNNTDVDIIIGHPKEPRHAALTERAKRSAEFFHLEEVYNQVYELEITDVVRKVLYLPGTYLTYLKNRYPGIEESVLNLMFLGSSLDPDDVNKLAHEKLRQDIYSQLWIPRTDTDCHWKNGCPECR